MKRMLSGCPVNDGLGYLVGELSRKCICTVMFEDSYLVNSLYNQSLNKPNKM